MNMPDEKALRHLNDSLNLEPLWMPFTANRQFKAAPRLLVAAKDMHYLTQDGRKVLDGIAGLWAVNAGHCRQKIVDAIKKQAETIDYATGFQLHHPAAFQAAEKLVSITPKGLDHVFFTNSGSEAVDTALKIALAYHRVRGEGLAGAAESGDYFVEYQQDAVLVADLAQLLQITFRRHQHAGGAGDRLDNHRGDV